MTIMSRTDRERAVRGELWRARYRLRRLTGAWPNPNPAQRVSIRDSEAHIARLEARLKEIAL
jgi:hypothetical protein